MLNRWSAGSASKLRTAEIKLRDWWLLEVARQIKAPVLLRSVAHHEFVLEALAAELPPRVKHGEHILNRNSVAVICSVDDSAWQFPCQCEPA